MIYIPKQPPSIPIFNQWKLHQKSLYINCEDFFNEVIIPCNSFDAITYTVSEEYLDNCRKLLCAKFIGHLPKYKCEIRLAKNVHTKLYIVRKNKRTSIWIGSLNLRASEYWHNIMMRVDDKENAKSLMLYFNRLWSLTTYTMNDSIETSMKLSGINEDRWEFENL